MKVFRIYLGGKRDLSDVLELVSKYFDGATLYPERGMWKGRTEYSTIIEIITNYEGERMVIRKLARELKERFNQESVLITSQDVDAEFV